MKKILLFLLFFFLWIQKIINCAALVFAWLNLHIYIMQEPCSIMIFYPRRHDHILWTCLLWMRGFRVKRIDCRGTWFLRLNLTRTAFSPLAFLFSFFFTRNTTSTDLNWKLLGVEKKNSNGHCTSNIREQQNKYETKRIKENAL